MSNRLVNMDWSGYLVQVQPLARTLNELMNRREYEEAAAIAVKLSHISHMLSLYAAEKNGAMRDRNYYEQ